MTLLGAADDSLFRGVRRERALDTRAQKRGQRLRVGHFNHRVMCARRDVQRGRSVAAERELAALDTAQELLDSVAEARILLEFVLTLRGRDQTWPVVVDQWQVTEGRITSYVARSLRWRA